ncbi:MAG: energy-coupling factor transporter transmembrane component T family protein [Anaerolineae bacterium]
MSPSEFELLRGVTLGQYLPRESLLHRTDPRVKLVAGMMLVVAVVATSSLAGLSLTLALVLLGFSVAQVPIGYALSGVRPMLPFLALLALIQMVAIPQNDVNSPVLGSLGFVTLTVRDFTAGALLILKFAVLVWGISLLSFTTTTTELTHGTEHLLRPLQRTGFPAHELALTFNIALRFVPILAEETEWLMKAQASRGADFGGGRRLNFIQRTRRMVPLIVPLILASLQRAEELILAMETRCYTGGKGRTYLIHLQAKKPDYLLLLLVLLTLSATVVAGILSADTLIWRALKIILMI